MTKMFDVFKQIRIPLFIHTKRQSRYGIICEGEVQDASGKGIQEGDHCKVYVDDSGKVWIRKMDEFHDGRFSNDGYVMVD